VKFEDHVSDGGRGSPGPAIIALNHWLASVGVTAVTAWRWRKLGWLKTTNIAGRVYLTQAAIDEFTRRAEAGEFAQAHVTPGKAA
jgi:hypothetical protein